MKEKEWNMFLKVMYNKAREYNFKGEFNIGVQLFMKLLADKCIEELGLDIEHYLSNLSQVDLMSNLTSNELSILRIVKHIYWNEY